MPLSPATDDSDSGDDAPPPPTAGAPPAAASGGGGGSDGSRSSSRSGPPHQAEASDLPAPEAAGEEDEETASAQGGGAKGAMVVASAAGGKRKRAPEFKFTADQATNKTKMVRVNQRGEGTLIQIAKPLIDEESDDKDRMLAYMFDFVDVLRNRERNLKSRADNGGTGGDFTADGSKPTREELRILGMTEALPRPILRSPGWSLYGRTPHVLPGALVAELERDWCVEIRHDVRDIDGNLFVPGGENKGTMCGAFPHGIRTLSSGIFRGDPCYHVAGNRDVSLQVRLVRKNCADPTKWTEQAVLSKIRAVVPEAEQRLWGAHESALSYHLSARFEDGSPIVASREEATATDGFSFKADVASGRLLRPSEGRPGDGGFYDFVITNSKGNCEGFYFNAGATHTKLVAGKACKKWVFEAVPLNPYLAQVKSFYAVSVPFCVKSSLAPGIGGHERYVHDGEDAPPRQVANSKVAFKAQMTRRVGQ